MVPGLHCMSVPRINIAIFFFNFLEKLPEARQFEFLLHAFA